MTPDQVSAFLEYEELKLTEKSTKIRLDELKKIITPLVDKDRPVAAKEGTFVLMERANWKFSDAVTMEEDKLEKLKESEIAKGVAINRPTLYVQYNVNK